MNKYLLCKSAGMFAALSIAISTLAVPQSAEAKKRYVSKRPGEVVFLRGLANIFSLGLDTLSDELKKYGVYSYVHNHKAWEKIGQQIIAKKPQGAVELSGCYHRPFTWSWRITQTRHHAGP